MLCTFMKTQTQKYYELKKKDKGLSKIAKSFIKRYGQLLKRLSKN